MRIAGISSKKFGDPNEGVLDNKNLYNDKELFDDADLDWYDYGFRNYDPQIGRFPQLDPLTDDYPELTPYQYASDEPIANVDVDGLEKFTSLTPVVVQGAKKSVPLATTNVFKLSTKIIPTLGNIAATHSEQSSVSKHLQANIQYQLGSNTYQQNHTKTLEQITDAMEGGSYLLNINNKPSAAKLLGKISSTLPWLQLGQNIIDKDRKGAVQTIMEMGISKTPLGEYYYGYKVLKFVFANDQVIGEAGRDARNMSLQLYRDGVMYERAGNDVEAQIRFNQAIRYERIAIETVHMLKSK